MTKKPKRTKLQVCRICVSPYRAEIEERVLKKKESKYSVAKAYAKAFHLNFQYVYDSMKHHFRKHLDRPFKEYEGAPVISFEMASKILLQEGMEERKRLKPKEKLDLAQKIEKTVIYKQQAKTQENALKLAAAKFFGGFIEEGEIVENGQPKLPETIKKN